MPFYAIEECKQCKTRLNRRATKTSEYIQARSSNERDNDSIIGSEVHEVWRRGDYRVRQLNGACSSRPRILNLSFFFHNCFRKRPLSGFYVNCTVCPLSRSREVTTTTTTTTSVEDSSVPFVGSVGKIVLLSIFFPFLPEKTKPSSSSLRFREEQTVSNESVFELNSRGKKMKRVEWMFLGCCRFDRIVTWCFFTTVPSRHILRARVSSGCH